MSDMNLNLDEIHETLQGNYVCFLKGTNIKFLYNNRLTRQLARVQYLSIELAFPVHLLTVEPEYDDTEPTGAQHEEEWKWVPEKGLHVKPDNDDRIQCRSGKERPRFRRFKNKGDPVSIGDQCYVMGLPFLVVTIVKEDPRLKYRYIIESNIKHFKTGWYRVSKNALRLKRTMEWTIMRNTNYFSDYYFPELDSRNNRHYRIPNGGYIVGSNIRVISILQRCYEDVLVVLEHIKVPIWVRMTMVFLKPKQVPQGLNRSDDYDAETQYILGYESLAVKVMDERLSKRRKGQCVKMKRVQLLSEHTVETPFGLPFLVAACVLTEKKRVNKVLTRRSVLHSIDNLKLIGWEDSHKVGDYALKP